MYFLNFCLMEKSLCLINSGQFEAVASINGVHLRLFMLKNQYAIVWGDVASSAVEMLWKVPRLMAAIGFWKVPFHLAEIVVHNSYHPSSGFSDSVLGIFACIVVFDPYNSPVRSYHYVLICTRKTEAQDSVSETVSDRARIVTTIWLPSQLFPKVAGASWVHVPTSVWRWSVKNTDEAGVAFWVLSLVQGQKCPPSKGSYTWWEMNKLWNQLNLSPIISNHPLLPVPPTSCLPTTSYFPWLPVSHDFLSSIISYPPFHPCYWP